MKTAPVLALLACMIGPAYSQESARAASLPPSLSFESSRSGGFPTGWSGAPVGSIVGDPNIVHGGRFSARLDRLPAPAGSTFSTITKWVPVDFSGQTVQLRGFLRTEQVSEYVGLWMRQDGYQPSLEFENMQSRRINGTRDWEEFAITLPLNPAAKQLYFGVLVGGTGRAWADDLQLLVDGKPIWEAAQVAPRITGLDTDHQFDRGSGVTLSSLTPAQVQNLTTLGRVWGYLKYHHPAITRGTRHWDYDLFRVLPTVLEAPDAAGAQAAMLRWIEGLPEPGVCDPCAGFADGEGVHLKPDVTWIADEQLLGSALSAALVAIHARRPAGEQFFVSLKPGVKNPSFDFEPSYSSLTLPDAGYQILAAFRFWNAAQYWFPNRDVIGEPWENALSDSIAGIALAGNRTVYQQELLRLIARLNDTHANLWSSLSSRPPMGACQVPVVLRFIEGQAVVTDFRGSTGGLRVGDALLEIDGRPVTELVAEWTPYYADSNQAARQRDIARAMTQGTCGAVSLAIDRQGETLRLNAARVPTSSLNLAIGSTHDLPGETFQLLSSDVAYLKLSSVKLADAASYLDRAAGTKGLVIDVRNYPSEFVVFALGNLLTSEVAPFARFTAGDLAHPGAFHWDRMASLAPARPYYAGKVVVLVDEVTQSQAEYTAMAFRAAGAKVIGSTTAGADGNVSSFSLPGGLSTMFSGIGVFYPDKRPTQRVGIVPDVEVRPTLEGIRNGRDEVLEAGLRQILGPDVPAAEIENLARSK